MLEIIEIQLFWASFALIGAAFLLGYRKVLPSKAVNSLFWQFLSKAHWAIVVLIALCTGFVSFVPVIAMAYVFVWPVGTVVLYYLAMLAASVLVVIVCRADVVRIKKLRLRRLNTKDVMPCLLVTAVLGLDYAMALHTGSLLSGDVPVHIAKIQLYINGHFTLSDPFLGYRGIIDLRYSTNLLNGLQAVVGKLVGVSSATVWFYSYAFYRLMIWVSLFALAKTFIPSRFPKEWPVVIMLLCPFIYNGYFFTTVELPHAIVLAWISLLLIGLKLLFDKGSAYILLLAAVLIASTHALASLETLGFVLLLLLVLTIAKKINRRQFSIIGLVAAILIVPIIANLSTPSRSTDYAKTKTTIAGLHGVVVKTKEKAGITFPVQNPVSNKLNPPLIDLEFVGMSLLLVPYVILLRNLKRPKAKVLVFAVIALAFLAVYNVLYMCLIGAIFLIKQNPNKQVKWLILLAMSYYALIAYNPVILTLSRGRVPFWFIARFQDFNTLAYIMPPLGLLALYSAFVRYWRLPKLSSGYIAFLIVIAAALVPIHAIPVDTNRFLSFDSQNKTINKFSYIKVHRLRAYDPYLRDQIIFTNNDDISKFMVSATSGEQMGVVVNDQSNQAQNFTQRTACQKQIFINLRLADLQAAHVQKVVLLPGNTYGLPTMRDDVTLKSPADEPYKLADTKSYLKFEKQIGPNRIYSVKQTKTLPEAAKSICNLPYGQ